MAQDLVFSRIDLSKTDYKQIDNCRVIERPNTAQLNIIYSKYCAYKQFSSVRPIFENEYHDKNTEVLGYYNNGILVAFSLIKILDSKNVDALQFAWDYKNPKLRLGIKSLENECAIYKARNFKYLHLGLYDKYKSTFAGFEILKKL